MKYSFVIPCYNSELTISSVTDEIKEKMKSMDEDSYEIILVNDFSKDSTEKVIFQLAEDTHIKAISLAKNAGQDAACLAGYRKACGEYIISLDDDGQTPADEVDKLLDKLILEDYDIAIAHYQDKKHAGWRNLGSYINDLMERQMLNKPANLYVGSYFAAKKFVIDSIVSYPNPYPYIRGLLLSTSASITNVDVKHRERKIGTSQYTMSKLLKLWLNGFTSFSIKPLRISTFIGALIAIVGFFMVIYAIFVKITNPNTSAGWASLMSITTFLGGVILLMLGMIGEYIGRIYVSINKVPQYVIKKVKD